MGQRADGKYGRPDGVNEVNYGEKTSKYGHYELADWGHAGTNTDGTRWKSQNMEWVEDNRKFEAPAAKKEPVSNKPEGPPPDVVLSDRAAQANRTVNAYEQVLANQGDSLFANNSTSKEQTFKDNYTDNLTEAFKAKDPVTLAAKKAEIELADKHKGDIEDRYSLKLGSY